MTVKMIGYLLILIIIAVFSAFNLGNTSDIELGFHKFKDVPIFLSLLFAFILGSLVMIPFSFKRKKKTKKQEKESLNPEQPEDSLQLTKSEEK